MGYPVIPFHQFAGDDDEDLLLLFAAPARALAAWAAVPRKGWRLRMLYQRWVTPGRDQDLRRFWNEAATYSENGSRYLLGPTALTIAATGSLSFDEGGTSINLDYERPFKPADDDFARLTIVAEIALTHLEARLSPDELQVLSEARADLDFSFPDYEHNHVLHSTVQIAQLAADAQAFSDHHQLTDRDRRELIEALEVFARPGLVVDGQHRLLGAAQVAHDIWLPVVLIPDAAWVDQIYQFVTINETAKKVDTSLLTDIFGNSLTPAEQDVTRKRFAHTKIDVEARIAAVIAGQHPDSPFRGLVSVALGDSPPPGVSPGFLTEATIRSLIEGGRGATPGWRTDTEFYETYVKPTIPDIDDWQSWSSGHWHTYWFAFWRAVRHFYNEEAGNQGPLWAAGGSESQTNLTKAVTLRLLQELFMRKAIERAESADNLRDILQSRFSEDEAEQILAEEMSKLALPSDPAIFEAQVREWFLSKGVPVRVLLRPWVGSLDDAQGVQDLREELSSAYSLSNRGERYHARNAKVFAVDTD